jgi:hypothetical protein
MSIENNRSIRPFMLLTALLFAVCVLFSATSALAQESASKGMGLKGAYTGALIGQPGPANYVELNPAKAGASAADDPAHQGITLHGHWTIDVKDPDGTLVKHNSFENQLQYDGTQYLTALLSGYAAAGDYAIYFTNATATPTASATTNVVCPAPASTTTSTFPYCSIVQNINTQPGIFHCQHYVCVSGLTATPTFGSGVGLPNFTLAGSITAPQAGAVVNVYVGFAGCNIASTTTPVPTPTGPATITPAACEASITNYYGGTMSGTTITPITVVAGQIIQITVSYTFS